MDWLDENWFPLFLVSAMAVGIGIIFYVNSGEKYVTIPQKFCAYTYTGNTKTVDDVTYVCAGYNKDGACTVNVPVYSSHIEKEVNVVCNFNEWHY